MKGRSPMTFSETAAAYERAPAPATLAALRADILAAPSYRPDTNAVAATASARSAELHSDVVAVISQLMPGSYLSPSAHGLLVEAHTALGDTASADRHRTLGKLAVRSILATGDGTQDAPWGVLMISDEYDVLQVLGRRSTGQQLVRLAGRRYDKHTHPDGTTSWFDITALPEPRATAVGRG